MDFKIDDDGPDFATLVVHPGKDDSFHVGGYNDGSITLSFPLYAHEARSLIEVLQPLADKKDLS